jgi:hypothetical protein
VVNYFFLYLTEVRTAISDRLISPSTAKLKNNPYSCKGSLMTSAINPPSALTPFPDHTQLPESDDRLAAQLKALGVEPEV